MAGEAPSELILRARHDRAAFGELYDFYLPRVYGFCRKYSATRDETEDLTAETFERALGAISRYEERGMPFSSWLLRIARNVIVNHARRAGRESTPGELSSLLDDEEQLQAWAEAYWLRAHVARLPDDQREVVRLRFYEDQRFQEVAAKMGRSEGAVKQLLRRALKTLDSQLQEEAGKGVANDR